MLVTAKKSGRSAGNNIQSQSRWSISLHSRSRCCTPRRAHLTPLACPPAPLQSGRSEISLRRPGDNLPASNCSTGGLCSPINPPTHTPQLQQPGIESPRPSSLVLLDHASPTTATLPASSNEFSFRNTLRLPLSSASSHRDSAKSHASSQQSALHLPQRRYGQEPSAALASRALDLFVMETF